MVPTVVEGSPDVTNEALTPIPETTDPLVNAPEVPDPLENTAAGVFIAAMADNSANEEIIRGETEAPAAETPEAPTAEVPAASGENTGKCRPARKMQLPRKQNVSGRC